MLNNKIISLSALLILTLVFITSMSASAFENMGILPPAAGISAGLYINIDTQENDPSSTLSQPKIDIWYGSNQSFGQLGMPQNQINILGNVSDPQGISSLSYSLNGGPENTLSLGPDTRRLLNPGDFNVEIFDSDPGLLTGINQVVITAKDGLNNTTTETITVDYDRGNVWPLPFSVNWDSVSSIQDVAQVIDGQWDLTSSGVRVLDPGYDRLIAIGDVTWENYEITIPITIHDNMGNRALIGFLIRWNGHTDWPISGWQPNSGWVPFGAIGAYTWLNDYIDDRLIMNGSPSGRLAEDFSGKQLNFNTPYYFKMRVESIPTQGALYALKVWQVGGSEPTTWDLIGQASPGDPTNGSLLLLAHMVDATFGDVTIQPIPDDSDPPQISKVKIKTGQTSAVVTWETDEPASGRVAYGPSTNYEFGYSANSDWGEKHSILLTGLSPGNNYHLQIESSDTQGNTTIDKDRPFATNNPDQSAGVNSNDFNVCSLDSNTWTFIDPVGDASHGLTGTFTNDAWLTISVPGGTDHDNWIDKYNAPRLMQPAGNADLEVELKFESGLNARDQNQGLLVEESQGGKDYLRFEFVNAGSGTDLTATIFTDGFPSVKYDQTIAAENVSPLFLRLSRSGDDWSLSYSLDGSSWISALTFTYPLNVTAVGAYAGNSVRASSPPVQTSTVTESIYFETHDLILQGVNSIQASPAFTGVIDYFMLTTTPIIPEDGDRNSLVVTASPPEGGSVDVDPDKQTYNCGDQVTLTANPQPGWFFSAWGGDLSGSENPANLQMNGGRQITSTFSQIQFNLSVNILGGGSVIKNPDQPAYDGGQIVQLLAIPQPGWTFTGWSGDLSGNTNPTNITLNGDRNVTATFSPIPYSLEIIIVGNGAVTKIPDQQTYTYGDQITLNAHSDPGWLFNDWTGDLNSNENPVVITMDGGKTITAHFSQEEDRVYYVPLFMNEP
jgi:uncharacterized repeat protein (TIGR02543 family)